MAKLSRMSSVIYEDRTTETAEQAAIRELTPLAMLLAGNAYQCARGDERIAARSLAAALGLALARSGLAAEEVIAVVNQHHERAKEVFERNSRLASRLSDA
jgi:hypothetical protein